MKSSISWDKLEDGKNQKLGKIRSWGTSNNEKFENQKLGKLLIMKSSKKKTRSWEKLEVGKTSNNEEFKKLEVGTNQKLGIIRSWETWM